MTAVTCDRVGCLQAQTNTTKHEDQGKKKKKKKENNVEGADDEIVGEKKKKRQKIKPKTVNIGTLNIDFDNAEGENLQDFMVRKKLHTLCIQKYNATFNDTEDLGNGYKLFFSSGDRGGIGVGIVISKEWKVIKEVRVSERLICLSVLVKDEIPVTIVSVSAPPNGSSVSDREDFYNGLTRVIYTTREQELLWIGGFFNAQVGARAANFHPVHGGFGFGLQDIEGKRLLMLLEEFHLYIANTRFRKRSKKIITCVDDGIGMQVDYIIIRKSQIENIKNCSAVPKENCKITRKHKPVILELFMNIDISKEQTALITEQENINSSDTTRMPPDAHETDEVNNSDCRIALDADESDQENLNSIDSDSDSSTESSMADGCQAAVEAAVSLGVGCLQAQTNTTKHEDQGKKKKKKKENKVKDADDEIVEEKMEKIWKKKQKMKNNVEDADFKSVQEKKKKSKKQMRVGRETLNTDFNYVDLVDYMANDVEDADDVIVGEKKIKRPKKKLKIVNIGTLNIDFDNAEGENLQDFMVRKKLHMLCIQKYNATFNDTEDLGNGYKLFFSSGDPGGIGVGIVISKEWKVIKEVRVSERLICLRVVKDIPVTIVSVSAPPNGSSVRNWEYFYNGLRRVISRTREQELLWIGGFFNAQVGARAGNFHPVHGGFGFGLQDIEGKRLLMLLEEFDLYIANTHIEKSEKNTVTCVDDGIGMQVDYIIIRSRQKGKIRNCFALHEDCQITKKHKPVILELLLNIDILKGQAAFIASARQFIDKHCTSWYEYQNDMRRNKQVMGEERNKNMMGWNGNKSSVGWNGSQYQMGWRNRQQNMVQSGKENAMIVCNSSYQGRCRGRGRGRGRGSNYCPVKGAAAAAWNKNPGDSDPKQGPVTNFLPHENTTQKVKPPLSSPSDANKTPYYPGGCRPKNTYN